MWLTHLLISAGCCRETAYSSTIMLNSSANSCTIMLSSSANSSTINDKLFSKLFQNYVKLFSKLFHNQCEPLAWLHPRTSNPGEKDQWWSINLLITRLFHFSFSQSLNCVVVWTVAQSWWNQYCCFLDAIDNLRPHNNLQHGEVTLLLSINGRWKNPESTQPRPLP